MHVSEADNDLKIYHKNQLFVVIQFDMSFTIVVRVKI